MFFDDEEKEGKEWHTYLNDEAKEILDKVQASIQQHRGAFSQAENKNVAQLWTAIIELRREMDEVKGMLGKLEEPWKAIIAVGDAEKKKTVERIVSEMIKPVDEETQEATKKLVESLMKF